LFSYRYQFSYINAKKDKSLRTKIALIYTKSPNSGCYNKLKTSWIMSTNRYHVGIYALLHNHNLAVTAESDVITSFQRLSILGDLFRNLYQKALPDNGWKIL